MTTDIQTIAIQEKDLELVVSAKTLGSLTTNAIQIRDLVKNALPKYDISNYNESNIDVAKKDKAMLNNASKVLTAKRIELEKEFLKPFDELKNTITETVKLIGECSGKIDTVVKTSEQKEKDAKRATIQKHWDSKAFTLVTLDKVFDDKWLNKGSKEKDIFKEIDTKIAKINDDLVTLEAIGQDVELLKSIYLGDLDLNKAIQYANTLKANKAKVQQTETTPAPTPIEQPKTVAYTAPVTPVQQTETTTLTRAFKVTASKELIIELGDFMNQKGIVFEKIEL
jgi:hypothetical protein